MKLYWDFNNHRILSSLSTGDVISKLDWILRDSLEAELYVVAFDSATGAYVIQDAPAGTAPMFGLKVVGNYAAAPLAGCDVWVKSGSGVTAKYTGTISLNTTLLIAAVGTAASLDVTAEFTFKTVAGVHRDSTQVDCTVTPDVNRTGEALPTAAQSWPWLEEFTHVASGKKCLRLKNSDGETLIEIAPPGVQL